MIYVKINVISLVILMFGKHSGILYFGFNVSDFVLVKLLTNELNALLFDVFFFSFFKHRNLKTLWVFFHAVLNICSYSS